MSKESPSTQPDLKQRLKAVGNTALHNPNAFGTLYLMTYVTACLAPSVNRNLTGEQYLDTLAVSYLAIPLLNTLINARRYDKAIRGKSKKGKELRDESHMIPLLWKAGKTGKAQKPEQHYIDTEYVGQRRAERQNRKEKIIFWRNNNTDRGN